MPSASRSFIRDHGLHMKNMMLHLHRTRIESGRSSMPQTRTKTVSSPMSPCGYNRDWATEGYRRVAAPQAGHDFDSMYLPDHHSVSTQSAALSMSPQMLEAILRSSDAADFSTEDLTRLQEGISHQLARVTLPNYINLYVHLVESHHRRLLGSLTHTDLLILPTAAKPRRNLSSS